MAQPQPDIRAVAQQVIQAQRVPKRGYFVVYGPAGSGKSFAALKAFQKSLYIGSDTNNSHYYDVWLDTPKGRASKCQPPVRKHIIAKYAIDGVPNMHPVQRIPMPVFTKGAFEAAVRNIFHGVWAARSQGQWASYNWVIIDEMNTLLERVWDEISPTILTHGGKPDTRTAYGVLAKWFRETIGALRSTIDAGVGLVLVTHDQEPDPREKKKGGPKLSSRGIMSIVAAECDGLFQRVIEDVQADVPWGGQPAAPTSATPTFPFAQPSEVIDGGRAGGAADPWKSNEGVLVTGDVESGVAPVMPASVAESFAMPMPAVNPKSKRLWRVHVSQDRHSKFRGLGDEFFDAIKDKELEEFIPQAKFDL